MISGFLDRNPLIIIHADYISCPQKTPPGDFGEPSHEARSAECSVNVEILL